MKETRDAVINSRGEHGVTQDKVFYNVLTDKEGQAYLTVDIFSHFTFNNDVLGENLVLNSSPSEKFEKVIQFIIVVQQSTCLMKMVIRQVQFLVMMVHNALRLPLIIRKTI